MNRANEVTRVLFEAFPAAEVRLFYVLAYAAIGVFCYGVYVQIRKYRRGAALKLEGSLVDGASATWSRRCSTIAPSRAATRRPAVRIG